MVGVCRAVRAAKNKKTPLNVQLNRFVKEGLPCWHVGKSKQANICEVCISRSKFIAGSHNWAILGQLCRLVGNTASWTSVIRARPTRLLRSFTRLNNPGH